MPICVTVMRMSGSRRLILNTNMWTEMKCEKADSKRVRFTGQDIETGQIRIFLVTVSFSLLIVTFLTILITSVIM